MLREFWRPKYNKLYKNVHKLLPREMHSETERVYFSWVRLTKIRKDWSYLVLVCIWRNKHSYILLGSLNCSLEISLAVAVIIKIHILFDVAISIEDNPLYRNKSNYKNMELFLPKMLAFWKKSYDKPRQHVKKQRRYFANKCLYSKSYGFFQ